MSAFNKFMTQNDDDIGFSQWSNQFGRVAEQLNQATSRHIQRYESAERCLCFSLDALNCKEFGSIKYEMNESIKIISTRNMLFYAYFEEHRNEKKI